MFDWLYSTGAAAITAVTASVAGTVGAVGSVLGCTSAGITAGSAMAGMMSTAATLGHGMGLVSTLQSAGTIFATVTGGSMVAAGAAIAAPIAVGGYLFAKGTEML